MNTHSEIEVEATLAAAPESAPPAFTRYGMKQLELVKKQVNDFGEILEDLGSLGGENIQRRIDRMRVELDTFAPSITFIGQIKSGKTTLLNAMSARPDLLPADVNPWTSVVTSVHLDHVRGEDDPKAVFTFFEEGEWDHLMNNGGRVGELSARVGADDEHKKLIAQINTMRDKTKARLGRKFELLLGQSHKYKTVSDDLIQRYVCLGDEFDEDADRQGQFADITKTAELHFPAPYLPIPITLRDTPGMNDTFLMREQITIGAIRESNVAVVVLSAHQALNATDMGLIRLISNVKSRQVIIFINRIDELGDPMAELPEIRASITKTLRENQGPEDPTIVFGSALWANHALAGTLADLPDDSRSAMENFSGLFSKETMARMDDASQAWVLSGIPQLYSAIGERVAEGPAKKALIHVRRRATNILEGMRASAQLVSIKANSDQVQKLSVEETDQLIEEISERSQQKLDQLLETTFDGFSKRVDQANERYIARALEALISHLEKYGEDGVWSYSADGMRSLMRTSYQVMTTRLKGQLETLLAETAADVTDAYGKIFDVSHEHFTVAPPPVPQFPAPVSLAQTIVLDVNTSAWRKWWAGRKGYEAYAKDFRALIEAETQSIIGDLKESQTMAVRVLAKGVLGGFIHEQRVVLTDMCRTAEVKEEDLNDLFGVTSQNEREHLIDLIAYELSVHESEAA